MALREREREEGGRERSNLLGQTGSLQMTEKSWDKAQTVTLNCNKPLKQGSTSKLLSIKPTRSKVLNPFYSLFFSFWWQNNEHLFSFSKIDCCSLVGSFTIA